MNLLLDIYKFNNIKNDIIEHVSKNYFQKNFKNRCGDYENIILQNNIEKNKIIGICHGMTEDQSNLNIISYKMSKLNNLGIYEANKIKSFLKNIINEETIFYVSPYNCSIETFKIITQDININIDNIIIHPLCSGDSQTYIDLKNTFLYFLNDNNYNENKNITKYCSKYKIKDNKWWEHKLSLDERTEKIKKNIFNNNHQNTIIISESDFLTRLFNFDYFYNCEFKIFDSSFKRFEICKVLNIKKIQKIEENSITTYQIKFKLFDKNYINVFKMSEIRKNIHDVVKTFFGEDYHKIFPSKFPPANGSYYYWRRLYIWFEYFSLSIENKLYPKYMLNNMLVFLTL